MVQKELESPKAYNLFIFLNVIYSLKTGSRSRAEYIAFLIRRTHLLLPLPKNHVINLQISNCYFVYLAFHEKIEV